MTELWLKFKDETGDDQRVIVEGPLFMIGRHSTNDLCVPNGKLSREHAKIERFGDVFVITDLGSSNGTTVNGTQLRDPVTLKAGDRVDLGGGIEIEADIVSDDPYAPAASAENEDVESEIAVGSDEPEAAAAGVGVPGAAAAAAGSADNSGGIPGVVYIIAPILGVVVLVMLVGIIYLASGGSEKTKAANDDDFVYSTNRERDKPPKNRDDPPANSSSPANNSSSNDPPPTNSGSTTNADPTASPIATVNLSDSAKCEQSGAAFLRSVAQNDPKAFVTGEQALIINGKIKQISSSSAIADNINSARRNAAQIKALAVSKNLKPQLLAAAALTKLGTSRGDALQAAKDMADTLDKLGTQIGSELASDTLLMIAAYDQGAAGDFMKMRNMLQDLATKSTASSREIRTIWFLHKNGKITDGEYNFALQFLAIGVITQNPKDFGVNTEPLVL